MSIIEMEKYVCDGNCAATVLQESGDDPPDGWAKNIEGEDFCLQCARLLDPYDPEVAANY